MTLLSSELFWPADILGYYSTSEVYHNMNTNVDRLAWYAGWYRKWAIVLSVVAFQVLTIIFGGIVGYILHNIFSLGADSGFLVDLLSTEDGGLVDLIMAGSIIVPIFVLLIGYREVSKNYDSAKAELIETVRDPLSSLDGDLYTSVTTAGSSKRGKPLSKYYINVLEIDGGVIGCVKYQVDMSELTVQRASSISEHYCRGISGVHTQSSGGYSTLYIDFKNGSQLTFTDKIDDTMELRNEIKKRMQ
ncbi:DUF4064 domain-containing protein [Halobacteria archaeon AArc-m2/3/4]|uniref:DUF4064 domain-containing protein n=1 Tax=Natronoglomus mannanivorans TaxID=2979990 RepID=A0ABT2QJK3_9EURY|nr:DUF4064 domain-containing protein [Halobacteria archaeon AArc-m2/3/4]